MRKKTVTTDQNLPKAVEGSVLDFSDLEKHLKYLLGLIEVPLDYYLNLKRGIEKFPSLNTADRIALLNDLLFLTNQFNNLSVHNFHDLIFAQLEKEETILALENRIGKSIVVNGENSNICMLSNPNLIIVDGTVTEFGNYVGAVASSKLNKKGNLLFHIEQDKLVSIILKTFVNIRGENFSENSLRRYISDGWNNQKIAQF